MSLNKVMLIGNVGQEPTVRYLDSGVCVASVRLATTDRGYTMRDGTQVPERAEWHSLIFWDKLAETRAINSMWKERYRLAALSTNRV